MRYSPGLDGLRAVAILVVLAFHARAPLASGGFLGVDVFFVLSGFLITRLLTEEHRRTGAIAVGKFYLRRFRRLYPALLLMLAVYLMQADAWFPEMKNHFRDAVLTALYLADYGRAFWRLPEVLQHTWSLSVEEHFYLVWPVFLLALLRLPARLQVPTLIAMFVAATLWRWHISATVDFWIQPYYRFDTRLSDLFLGAALSLWHPRSSTWFGVFGLVLIATSMYFATWRGNGSLTIWMLLAEIGTGLAVLTADRLPILGHRWCAWGGRMSYGIYLWHYPIMYWMRDKFYGWPEIVIVGGGVSVLLAAASYYLVERWFRSAKLEPKLASLPEAQQAALELVESPSSSGTDHEARKPIP